MELKRLSVSSMANYSSCGKKWQLERELRVPFVQSDSIVIGKSLHAGLETFNHAWFKNGSKDLTLPNEIFDSELKEHLDKNGTVEAIFLKKRKAAHTSPSELLDFRNEFEAATRTMGHDLLGQYAARTDHGERALMIEEEINTTFEGLDVKMIPDLLDVYKGQNRLRDYKTRARRDKKISRMQYAAYAFWLMETRGIDVHIIEQINFMKTKVPVIEVIPYDMKDLANDIEIFKREARSFIAGVRAGVFVRNRMHYCESCGVKDACFNPQIEQQHRDALNKTQTPIQLPEHETDEHEGPVDD